ncbi:chemotaxis protein CheX [Sporomusa sp.]|uniref:chemotaxis protein CheX n=1 Tax=Sporomusa sp. TaxID=2078658 RepID=UPI002C0C1C55|nr:chemotaxis protein CheX [Sporomusa sp.]HWR42615.1 chemotaxis protein CheX [Sporomusa sp.]
MELATNDFLQKCLSRAVVEVIGTIAGLDFSRNPETTQKQHVNSGGLTGAMLVHGERNAMLSITMSKEDAAAIVSAMTGVNQLGLSDADLYDGVAEMANMVAGRAKALLSGTGYHYTITAPFTIVGENHFIVYKKQASQVSMSFTAGEMIIQLGLAYV